MHAKSDNIKIMIGNETDEIIQELLDSLLQKYQKSLERLMEGIEFAFDSANLLYYINNLLYHKISLNREGSYIDSPKWLKSKKATINPKIMIANVFNMLQQLC